TMLWRPCRLSERASLSPSTMATRELGWLSQLINHLRPLVTYSSPSRRMLVCILVASEEATSGSLMAKHERISPASKGFIQRSLDYSLANNCRNPMLLLSGALQLNT